LPVSPVVFVPLVLGIADCERIEEKVRSGPLQRDIRFPYHPHVTVAHDLPAEALDQAFDALAGYEASFGVRGFTLFEQGPDATWRPQRDFVFGGGGLPGPASRPLEPPRDTDGGW
jgi:2'-5' RNA ligase